MNLLRHMATGILTAAEEPEYQLLKTYSEFEVRRYPETTWIMTTLEANTRAEAVSTGFWKVFYYIEGDNEKGEKMTMTTPILVKIEPGEGPDSPSRFTMGYYVSRKHVSNPVRPLSEDLRVTTLPPMTVLTRPFSGFADDEQWLVESRKLFSDAVNDYPGSIVKSHYYTAGYDSPFKLINRRNEVWLQCEDLGEYLSESDDQMSID